jgi:hypothetical protein
MGVVFKIEYKNKKIYLYQFTMSILHNEKHYLLPIISADGNSGGTISDFVEGAEISLRNRPEYQHVSKENKFRKISAYISLNEPHYQSSLIYEYLFPGKTKHDTWVGKFRGDNKDGSKIEQHYLKKVHICIPKDGVTITVDNVNIVNNYNKKDNVVLLTELGLMRAFGTATTDFAIMFQKLLLGFLRNVKKNHADIYKKCMEEEIQRRQDAEKINNQNINLQYSFYNPTEIYDPDKIELSVLQKTYMKEYFVYVVDWQYMNSKMWKKKSKNEEQILAKKDTPAKKEKPYVFPNHVTLAFKKEMTEYDLSDSDDDRIIPNHITLASRALDKEIKQTTKKRNKKEIKKNDTDPHPDGIQNSYDLYDLNTRSIKSTEASDTDEEYYFTILSKPIDEKIKNNYKYISSIYIKDINHNKEFIRNILKGETHDNRTPYKVNGDLPEYEDHDNTNEVKTIDSKVYITTYSSILSARSKSYIDLNKNILKGVRKTK